MKRMDWTRYNCIKALILLLVFLTCLLVWPVGLIKDCEMTRTKPDFSKQTGPITEVSAMQEFVPKHESIRSVGLDINKSDGAANQGKLVLRFFDKDRKEIKKVLFPIEKMEDGKLTDIPVHLNVTEGESVFLQIEAEDYGKTAPLLNYRSLAGNGPDENKNFYYSGAAIADASADIRYIYDISLGKKQVLFYDCFILLVGAFFWNLTEVAKKRKQQ